VQRWNSGDDDDMRMGPKTKPVNSLTETERAKVLAIANSREYRDLSPKQIVPILAELGHYVASESSFDRILKRHGQKAHRGPKRQKSAAKPREKLATRPNQVWSWDITLLRSPVVGQFFYLYMAVDIWSRKIVAFEVHERECSELSSAMMLKAMTQVPSSSLTLHQDNGGPMKGTLKACMENLGVAMSYSRPHVSDDNPYSESLFGTMKTRPRYPRRPFASLAAAQAWVDAFVYWYNEEHRHSSISFVTPAQRHRGESEEILAKRRCVYQAAKQRNPERWSGSIRKWEAAEEVFLNPDKQTLERLRN
jgi:transposase InsO family protein